MYERPAIRLPHLSTGIRTLIFVNVAVFAACFLATLVFLDSGLDRPVAYYLGLSWNGLGDWYGLGVLRFVTSIFAHSYSDPWHIIYNMVGLWLFGSMVEEEIGRRGIFHFYVCAGLLGGVLQLGLSALLGAYDIPAIGASGAVYGTLVYAAMQAPRMRTFFYLEMRWLAGIFVAVGVYMSILGLRHGLADGTAHGGHLGGALFGWVAFRRLRPFYVRLGRGDGPLFPVFARMRADRERQREVDRQVTLDQLLEKIQAQGIHALTPSERKQLERLSREMKRR
ncbi:MAG: rhomboid family intramembrane serine protease [Planctomycetes bacterium]|nr:rhomboid family intramembrane serine protease [Planctomycetota bacterium]